MRHRRFGYVAICSVSPSRNTNIWFEGPREVVGGPVAARSRKIQRARGLVVASRNSGSSYEGFSLVHREANSYGVPSIGSLNSGNEDAIDDGNSGFLCHKTTYMPSLQP